MKEQDRIREKDSWNRFWVTGRVEDYLHYVAEGGEVGRRETERAQQSGDNTYAGVYRGNRDYTETDAYR